MMLTRRRFLVTAAGSGLALAALPPGAVHATPETMAAAMREVLGDAEPRKGKVKLDLPVMVENGNVVPMTVSVEAPLQGPERALSLHVFAELNPNPNVANFYFGPRAGKPQAATRIRLSTSQTVYAVAKLADGTCWSDQIELLVTLAACLE
jgi:sulfur-oxidizing protein SoxY